MRLSHLNTRSFKALAVCGLAASFALAGCGGNSTESATSGSADAAASGEAGGASGDVINLTVGASPSPHAKVLHFIQDNLAAEAGINLEIVEYTDYHQPNVALNSGDLDANFYQTRTSWMTRSRNSAMSSTRARASTSSRSVSSPRRSRT